MSNQEILYFVHGSEDSIDHDVVALFPKPPSYQECIEYCSNKKDNLNIFCVKDGVVSFCFKGLPDELNNALLVTYYLHEQKNEIPIKEKVVRNVPLKALRTVRQLLSRLSRTNLRVEVKKALKSCDLSEYLKVLQKVNYEEKEIYQVLDVEQCKSFAFQYGQLIALIEGTELFTKKEVSKYFKDLKGFIYREKDYQSKLSIFNQYNELLIKLMSPLKVLKPLPYVNILFNNDDNTNLFLSQCNGMVLNTFNGNERCILFPPSDSFSEKSILVYSFENKQYIYPESKQELKFEEDPDYYLGYEIDENSKIIQIGKRNKFNNKII